MGIQIFRKEGLPEVELKRWADEGVAEVVVAVLPGLRAPAAERGAGLLMIAYDGS